MTATNIFYNFVGFRYSPALTLVLGGGGGKSLAKLMVFCSKCTPILL